MSEKFRMLAVQGHFEPGDVAANLDRMEARALCALGGDPGARLLLFPELAVSGYEPAVSIIACAEERDGPSFRRMSSLAAKLGIHLAYGYVESGGGGCFYNSLMLIAPDGSALANYRKIHLTVGEKKIFLAGDEAVAVDTDLGKIGLMICWDLAFPEIARMLALSGAEILLVPAAWDKPYARPFRQFASSRALDNSIFLATCNHVGRTGQWDFFGESTVYGPDGTIVACAGEDRERVASAEIDFAWSRELREGYYSMLKDRRPDIYGNGSTGTTTR